MPGVGDLFGEGSIVYQMFVYGVLQQVVGALIQPGLIELTKLTMHETTPVPLDASAAASALARRLISANDAQDAAADSGIDTDVLDTMTKLARHAPDLTAVLVAWRRGLVPTGTDDGEEISLRGALADAGIPTEWHDIITQVAITEPTGAEVMNALLEGQIDRAEALRRWKRAGMDPTWFQTAYDANGQAPTPTQALELLNRGIIPEHGTGPDAVSYQQAFLEGPWRNKWLAPFTALREYLPPPRTVTAMFKEGAIDKGQAVAWLTKQGLSADAIVAYLYSAHTTKVETDKHLTKADIIGLYEDKLITRDQAKSRLVALHYTDDDAGYLLDLADARFKAAQYRSGVNRVKGMFLAGTITATAASDTLGKLGVPHDQVAGIIAAWRLGKSTQVKGLTTSQVEAAWFYELIPYAEAMDLLVSDGYSEADAWTLLAIRNKGPIRDHPKPGGKLV